MGDYGNEDKQTAELLKERPRVSASRGRGTKQYHRTMAAPVGWKMEAEKIGMTSLRARTGGMGDNGG